MTHDFLAAVERPFRALRYRRSRRRHAALTPAAERFAPPLPPPPEPAEPFTCGEARYLGELEDWLAGHPRAGIIRRNGGHLADFFRLCIPEATDADLARFSLAAVKASSAWEGSVSPFTVYTDALGAAALELADMERSLA